MKTKYYTIPVGQYINMFKGGEIINYPGQRGEVWTDKKKFSLIDSIIDGFGLPEILLHKRQDGVLEILDGQQRTLALQFILDTYVDQEAKTKIFKYPLRIEEKSGFSGEELARIYKDRNSGVKLSAENIRKATVGVINNYIYRHDYPTSYTNIFGIDFNRDNKKKKYQMVRRILTSTLLYTGLIASKKEFTRLSFPALDKLSVDYNVNGSPISSSTEAEINKTLNLLVKSRSYKVSPSSLSFISLFQFVLKNREVIEKLDTKVFFLGLDAALDRSNHEEFPTGSAGGGDAQNSNVARIDFLEDYLRDFLE